jgi:endonuclease YncB( thermonuclease family)
MDQRVSGYVFFRFWKAYVLVPSVRRLNPYTVRILLLVALLTASWLVQAGTLTGRVVRVTDGDTLVVVDANYTQHRISLIGIVAPEYGQPFGSASRERLAAAVAGKFVVVEYARRDGSERIPGKVLLGNRDMNLEQLRAGLAWHDLERQYEQSRMDRAKYADAELDARRNKRGFWTERIPVQPRWQPPAQPKQLPGSQWIPDASRTNPGR